LNLLARQPYPATRLYQRAGMVVAGEFAMYEKELRAGES
jgi:hypothetical protein